MSALLSPILALNSAPPRLSWVGCDGSRRPLGLTRPERSQFSTSRSSHRQCHRRTGEDAQYSSGRTVPRRPDDRLGGRCGQRNRDRSCAHGRSVPRPPPDRRDRRPLHWRQIWPGRRTAKRWLSSPTAIERPTARWTRRTSISPPQLRPVLAPRRLTHLHGGVTSLAFSPDGLHIACLYIEGATRPAGALAPMKPPAGVIGVEGLEIQRVATIETASGEFRQVTPANLHVYEYDWAPDSRRSLPTSPHPRPGKTTGGWHSSIPNPWPAASREPCWTRNTPQARCTACRSRCPAGRRMGNRSPLSAA